MGTIGAAAGQARRLPSSRFKERAGRAFTSAASALGADPICVVALDDGTRMELDARSRTEAAAVWNGTYEPDYLKVLAELIDQFGNAIYDVGANVGLVAMPLARHAGSQATVVCFEPMPENCARLRRNVELNNLTNCRVYETALGAEEGVVRVAREAAHRASTGNAVIVTESPNLPGYDAVSDVRMQTLDAIVERDQLPLPAVIKLDVEGAEVGFLRGAQSTLRQARPVILGEFNSGLMPKFGTTFPDAAALLPPDYAIFGFVDASTVVEKAAEVGVGDVLLAPRECMPQLPLRIV